MPGRLLKVLPLGVFGSLLAVLIATSSPAQEPIPLVPPGGQPNPIPVPRELGAAPDPVQPAGADDVEVLAKGPVHEAFATTAEAAAELPVVAKQPPEPIEELPPDQKPEGDNVQWIPGYWHWDEEAEKFIWISGFWRQPPPGRVWVPGSWRTVKGGWQWVGGFWQEVNPLPLPLPNQNQQPQAQPEIEYLPEPPATLENGPSVVSPGESYFYSPGCWVWRNRYVWRPGLWVEYRPNWVWVPARYHWTPAGFVFCNGYWDYPLAHRGVLFAPVVFARPIYTRPAFVYTPAYVVSEPCMVGALFVRRGRGCYYFGDYFDNRYAIRGYSAWCGVYNRNGFSIGFGTSRAWRYDPLWSYYSVTYRSTPTWHRGVGDLYGGRYSGTLVRPPTTLVQQNVTINNITKSNVTNVTNNITVVNKTVTVNNKDVSNVAMVAPLKVAPDLHQSKFQTVNAEARRNEAVQAKQLRDVATQRTKLETAVVNQQPAVPAQPGSLAQPKSIKLDVPKAAITRAQVTDEKKAPPPPPVKSVNTSPGVKNDPPKLDPIPKIDKLPISPKFDPLPKVDPKPVNPLPKVDPKPVVNPPVNPLPKIDPTPKVDPRPVVNPLPKNDPPKIDPKPVVNPPVNPLPKVDPKPVVNPPVNPLPKIDPLPKVDPKPPVIPKVDPKPVVNPPVNPLPLPKVDPKPPVIPKVDPKPIVNPPVNNPPPRVTPAPPPPAPKIVNPPVNNPPPRVTPPPPPPPSPKPAVNPPPQPRPVTQPATQPPKVVQPPKAQPTPAPKATPAPPGKPRVKARRDKDSD